MALDSAVIVEELLYYDVLGASRCHGAQERVNLLVKTDKVEPVGSRTKLTAFLFATEGFGYHGFWEDQVFVPQDEVLDVQTILWNKQECPKVGEKLWIRNVLQYDLMGANYVMDDDAFWMLSVEPEFPSKHVNHLEFFTGGLGGWKSAADFICSTVPFGHVRTIAVEHEVKVALSYVLSNTVCFAQSDVPLPRTLFSDHDDDWIIRDDVMASRWKAAVASLGIHVITVSAPCPAWSAAHDAPGLTGDDGKLLLTSILECRFFRPIFILLEQVANFASHPHRAVISRVPQVRRMAG